MTITNHRQPLKRAHFHTARKRRSRTVCSADLQSAVSRICNPLSASMRGPADCKSAIQQIRNLRYGAVSRCAPLKLRRLTAAFTTVLPAAASLALLSAGVLIGSGAFAARAGYHFTPIAYLGDPAPGGESSPMISSPTISTIAVNWPSRRICPLQEGRGSSSRKKRR